VKKTTSLLACLIFFLFACSDGWALKYTAVKNNVSYTSVTELEFTSASTKLVYGEDDPSLQYGLLWVPADMDALERAPLVVFIHGGCWLNEFDIQHSFPFSTALAEAGYAVWSLEYRRTGDAGGAWPGSFDDIRQGLEFISNLKNHSLDLDRVVIAGHSAGGHLALLAGSGFQGFDAVIGLAAITDIVKYSQGNNSCQKATIDFMGGNYEANPAAYHAANPVDISLHERTILLHGDVDSIVPLEQARVSDTTAIIEEGAGHFDWIHPGTQAYQLLLSTLEDLFGK